MNPLPRALVTFRERFPGINVSVLDIVMENTLEAVRSGSADLGISFEPEQLEGLEFRPLFSDRFIALLPPGSTLAGPDPIAWESLCEQPFIAMNRGSWTRNTTDRAMREAGVAPAQLLEATQLATIGRMVATGLGVSVVPDLCREQMIAMGALCAPLASPHIERRVGIFLSRRHRPSRAATALAEVLVEAFSDRPTGI